MDPQSISVNKWDAEKEAWVVNSDAADHIPLDIGDNRIEVIVTADDGSQWIYICTVCRWVAGVY